MLLKVPLPAQGSGLAWLGLLYAPLITERADRPDWFHRATVDELHRHLLPLGSPDQ
jgi:hypothetical protein